MAAAPLTSICPSSSVTFTSLAIMSFVLRSGEAVRGECVCVCGGGGGGGGGGSKKKKGSKIVGGAI